MKFIAVLLGLPEDATEAQITAALNKLKQDKETAENAVKAGVNARAKALVTNAIESKQLVEADRAVFEPMAESNYDATEAMIKKIPAAKKPLEMINNKTGKVPGADENASEADNWENLIKGGVKAVAACKENEPAKYIELYKAHYGFEPNLEK